MTPSTKKPLKKTKIYHNGRLIYLYLGEVDKERMKWYRNRKGYTIMSSGGQK